ncbi:MAG: porin family protein [Lishizhenia sp.]
MNLSRVFFLGICVFISTLTFSQRNEKPKNYRKFDEKLLHFGFLMGVNTADFSIQTKPDLFTEYGIYSIQNSKQPGFQLGIISSMKLGHPSLRLRFIPSLSFTERLLTYSTVNPIDPEKFVLTDERVGSTSIDFPLLLKYRTLRYNNFAAYIIGGAQYSLDLQSQQDISQSFAKPFIKLNKHDIQGQIGAGVDFFMPYFKFGMELKMSHGLGNTMIQDNTVLSSPIETLTNRVWWFSITFEG